MTDRFTVGIVGSRTYRHEDRVREYVRGLDRSIVVVSGGASGPDTWAVDEAVRLGMDTEVYHADWEKHGRSAGFLRNTEIVNASACITAFWDGKSRGTLDTIRKATQAGVPVEILPENLP